MDICILVRAEKGQPNRKGFTLDSYNEMKKRWEPLINAALDGSNDGLQTREFQQLFKKALRDFGALMHGKDINANVQFILDWMSDKDCEWMEDFIPSEGLKNAISKKYQSIAGDIMPQYDESISEDLVLGAPSRFLEDKYGSNANLKNELKQKVAHKFINTFIIDREGNRLVLNATDANISARRHKLELFDTVCDYLGITKRSLFNLDGTYTGAFTSKEFLEAMRDRGLFELWEQSDIEQIVGDSVKYDAFTAWFTLKNYDNFLNLLLGDAIQVHPEARGKLANGDVYTFAEKHGANITSWKTDDNTVLSEVISSLAQSLIITTPSLKFGSTNPTGTYLKFEDFYRTITKIKDLVTVNDPILSAPIKNAFSDYFNSHSELTEFGNKSLREIINNIRVNPQKYTSIALLILASNEDVLKTLQFDVDERNKLYSIYKGIYSLTDSGSINFIQNQSGPDGKKMYSHNSQNYYSLISQVADSLFSVKFLQYNEVDGVITVRTLNDLGADNTRRAIELTIYQFNSKKIIHLDFKKHHMEPYGAHITYVKDKNDKSRIDGITLKVGQYKLVVKNKGKEFNLYIKDNSTGSDKWVKTNLNKSLNHDSLDYVKLLGFIDAQLGLNISGDVRMVKALGMEYGGESESNINAALEDLLKVASVVLMHKNTSNVNLYNKKGYKEIMETAAAAYGISINDEYLPEYNYDLNEMNLIPDKFLETLNRIAQAKTRVTGEAQSTLVKTADGDMLSQQTLSRLIGNLTSQWEDIRTSNGAASEFSLLRPGLYLGHYTSKELKSQLGNKAETQFTVAELTLGAFLYDFIGGLIPNNSKHGTGVVGFYPSVNSDKGTIGRIMINLNETCDRFGKAFKDLSVEELTILTGEELGRAYEKSYQSIKSDYNKLQDWAVSQGYNVVINPDTNFIELNEYAEQHDTSPSKFLFELTRKYNNLNPTKPIRLIDNVHYTAGVNGGIQFNNTYRALRSRYGNIDQLNRFMDRKRSELVASLLGENIEINLELEGDTNKETSKKWLKKNYADWMNPNSGRMVLAKLTYKGTSYDITNKLDLIKFAEAAKVSYNDLIDKPHLLLNYNMLMHPMLDKYNSMDYLFTQEFMMSGVGSHIAHPSKTKIKKTPIIWGHPGIGKTESLKNGKFANQFMDWDVEFNHLRDAWIEAQSGQPKYLNDEDKLNDIQNPLFKEAKNEYLINWKNHPEFKEFVKSAWKEVKAKAQSQNKILFASPAMLLELFKEDFDAIIDISRDDFILRGLSRGDYRPDLWKDGIDAILNTYKLYNAKAKVITAKPGLYLESMLADGSLQQFLDIILDNEVQEEAARFLAQHKRNVSYTAQMQEFLLGQLTGVPTFYNMAMMKDVKAFTYTISGDINKNDSYDGATFVNPYIVHWENNSLNSARAGIDKKQFVHFYDPETGTGGIVKTAGFGVTNDRMRRYMFYRTMNKNMTLRNWFNEDGSQHFMLGKGILLDFEGRDIDYGEIYYKKGNKYFYREIEDYLGNNKYLVCDYECDEYGHILNPSRNPFEVTTNSNYDMWEMFGGMRSMSEVNGKLQYSEASIENVAKAASNYGQLRPGHTTALTLDDVYQPMKHSDIHYMPTEGAVKLGACNINPASSFFNVVEGGVNFMRVKMTLAGIQLDKEHHANDSVLSLMTLVISAACSRGLMPNTSSKVYQALYELSKIGTKNFRDELGKLHIGEELDSEQFSAAVTDVIMKTILNSTATDGDMMLSIARLITLVMYKEGVYKFDKESLKKYDALIPYSSPEIFRKVVTSITTAMTKKGIKTKMPGVLSVLCPAHDIIKFYKVPVNIEGKAIQPGENPHKYVRVTLELFEDLYGIDGDENIIAKLDEFQANEPFILDVHSDVEIGYKYLISEPIINATTGLQEVINGEPLFRQYVVHVVRPDSLIGDKKDNLSDGAGGWKNSSFVTYNSKPIPKFNIGYVDLKNKLASTGAQIQEWARDGLDLHSYQVKFSDGVNNYQLGDLDIVLDYFKVKALDSKEQLNTLIDLIYNKYNRKEEFITRIKSDLLKNRKASDSAYYELLNLIIDTAINALETSNNINYRTNIYKAINDISLTFPVKKLSKDVLNKVILQVTTQFFDYILRTGIGFMNRTMQLTLDAISPSQSGNIVVKVGGKDVLVDKKSIRTLAYGIIMPKVFKENFGLDTFDTIEAVLLDPEFFTKKIVEKFSTKVESYPVDDDISAWYNNFDLELKRNDGNHIYIRLDRNNRSSSEVCGLTDSHKVHWFKLIDPDGKVYRIDGNNRIMYEMFSLDDEIYKDDDGNEIIIPAAKLGEYFEDADGNTISFYLNNLSYSTVNISDKSPDSVFSSIMKALEQSTNKLAKRYFDKVSKKPSVKEQRSLVTKLNTYTSALGDKLTNNALLEHIAEIGRDIYTSFLQSRKLVAARIPSQNQQSFMAMEVEALDNPDINTAYVSIFQFFLQGSDLDIDAVSLQVFDIDESGIFTGHSPYYSLVSEDMRKASEDIPFPTGKGTLLYMTLNVLDNTLVQIMQKYPKIIGEGQMFGTYTGKDGKLKLELHLRNPEHIKVLSEIILDINDNGLLFTTKEGITPADELLFRLLFGNNITLEQILLLNSELKRIVDDHNLYLKHVDGKTLERIIKNYAITLLYNIIIDPVNLLESWSSVDTVTGPVKDLAGTSPKATVQHTFSPGNVVNKFQSLNENMVGKDGIAICATGLKSFFAFTSTYLKILNDPNLSPEEKEKLMKPVTIGGKTYYGLANAYSPEFLSVLEDASASNDELFTAKMLDFLLEQLWAPDATADMSAMLGLSADNAKELVLAKINAGTATLGMYLYGMAIGVPITTLYDIINSPLGRRLTELTKGDYFNEDLGTRNILGALRFLKNEPSLSKFNKITMSNKLPAPGDAIIKQICDTFDLKSTDSPISKFINRKVGERSKKSLGTIADVKNALEDLRKNVSKYTSGLTKEEAVKYTSLYNRAIDAILQFIEDLQLLSGDNIFLNTIYGSSTIYSNLETLATGAEEMKTCGKILHLNQEIYTTPDKVIDLVHTIEELLINRSKIARAQARRLGIDKEKSPYYVDDDYLGSFDLAKFMTDDEYADAVIKLYDKLMLSFNVLRVIRNADNYKGYVESLLIAHKGLSEKSAKYKMIIKKAYPFISKYSVVDPNLQAKVVKNAENAVDMYIREKWMLKEGIKFKLPVSTDEKPVYVYIDSAVEPRINTAPRTINLGTPLGDANFKLWMERTVFPELKKLYPDNEFIRDIQPIISGTSDQGAKVINYGLRINMMPKPNDEYAVDLFNQYKKAFSELNTLDPYNGFRILDLLYLYSLISYKGKLGPQSLHGIFLDYSSKFIDSYRLFTSYVDKNADALTELAAYITENLLIPAGNPYAGGSDVIKYFDKSTEIPYILEKPEKNSEYDGYEGDAAMEAAGIDPNEVLLHFGEFYPSQRWNFEEANYSMFNTARAIVGLELAKSTEVNLETLDTRFKDLQCLLTARSTDAGIIGYKFKSINTEDAQLNSKITEALSNLSEIPTIRTKSKGKVQLIPDMDTLYQLIQDIKNNCQ